VNFTYTKMHGATQKNLLDTECDSYDISISNYIICIIVHHTYL